MAIILCSECGTEVSDSAKTCTSCGYELIKPTRTVFGKICKWSFIIFNLFMFLLLFSYFGEVSAIEANSDMEKAGVAIGAGIATYMIGSIWFVGDVILGMFVMFTRAK